MASAQPGAHTEPGYVTPVCSSYHWRSFDCSSALARARAAAYHESKSGSVRMKSLSIMIHDVNCMRSLISGGRQVARLPGSVELGELKIVAPELRRCGHGMLSDSCNVSRSLISSITLPIRSSFFVSDFASRIAVFGFICFVCIAIAPQALPDGGRDGDRVLAVRRARPGRRQNA